MATRVDRYFSEIDLKAIEDSVKRAESGTSGELAVTITPRTHHWLWLRVEASSVVALVAMVVTLWATRSSDWGLYLNFTQALLWGVVGFVLTLVISKPLFMRPARMRKAVWEKALKHFHTLQPTKGKTGVLFFVALEEHQAVIIADSGIASKLPSDYWHMPQNLMMSGINANKHAEGVIQAIDLVGVELSRHFPRDPNDQNELPDGVTIQS